MKQFLLPGVSASLALLAACSTAPVSQSDFYNYVPKTPDVQSSYALEPMSDKTAFDYLADEGIIVGWNIGNTLDAWDSNGSAEDVNWGNPRINQAIFNGVKEAGFDIVRIPITWMGYIGPAPDYRIRESFLKRVAEVVVYARNADLKVIINLHHDGSTQNSGKDNGWLSINTARADEAGYNKVTFQFIRVWKQIAEYFKNYGDWLMFESFNEIHDGGWGWNSESKQRPQYVIINEWNQFFTDTVRGTGSNNASRYLLIPGYVSAPQHTIAGYYVLPVDTVPNRQIVTFHYYNPYEFGILGDQKGGQSDWGSDEDKRTVDKDFAPFKERFIDKNIPVIIGESGAVRQQYAGETAKEDRARQARLEYVAHVFGKAREYGMIPVYWDNGLFSGRGEKFGLLSRTTGKPNSEESEAVLAAMINAVKH